MRKLFTLSTISVLTALSSCTTKPTDRENQNSKGLNRLYHLMVGEFSSEEQSRRDSAFFNINLVMHPIWKHDAESKWLYVEQAVTENPDRPYRQRVYKLSEADNNLYESEVYELPNPERFVHGWDDPEIFDKINPDSLIARQGCAVYLQEKTSNCFSGSTKDRECLSSLRGAKYATSIVTVCENEIVSWDQGWNSEDEQVWGAEVEGYIFKRKE